MWDAEVQVPPGLPELLEAAAREIEGAYAALCDEGHWPRNPEKLALALRAQAAEFRKVAGGVK